MEAVLILRIKGAHVVAKPLFRRLLLFEVRTYELRIRVTHVLGSLPRFFGGCGAVTQLLTASCHEQCAAPFRHRSLT